MAEAVLAVYLAIAAIVDILRRKLQYRLLLCGFVPVIVSVLCLYFAGDEASLLSSGLVSRALGLAVGLIFFILSCVTKERIGKGDAVIFCICGATMGIGSLIPIIMMSFLLSAVYSVAMLATGKLGKKSRIAFVPFIFLGYAMALTVGMI